MATTPTGTNLNGYEVKYWNRQTEADGDIMSQQTIMPMCSAIQANRDDIDTMKAATDVINVYGTYSEFETNSGEMVEAGYLTDYDIVKVLQDEEHDDMQTYWQCHKEGDIWIWDYVGDLAPYYSKNDINEFSASLSGTISSNYYASGNVTTAGKNLSATQTAVNGAPKVEISIKDKVEFVTVSATEKVSAKSALITDLSAEHIHIDSVSNDDWYNVALYSADAKKFFHDSDFKVRYNPDKNTLSSINYTCTNITGTTAKFTGFSGKDISANDGSTTATIKNLINSAEGGSAAKAWITDYTTDNSANSAINATNADHTKDVITSYYATESQAGTQTATFNVSSLKLSGNKTAGVVISKTTNNNVDYLYFKLNSGTVCNYVEDQNKYVKYTDTTLNIGDIDNLGVTGAATALGKYASASTYSYIINFGENSQLSSYATNKGFAVGDTNLASFNSFVIGHTNSALGSNDAQNKFIFGTNNEISETVGDVYIIGSTNTSTKDNSYIIGISNSIKSRAANNPTFVFGCYNDIQYTSQYYNTILGSYADTNNPDTDNFFIIGNGNSVKKHNALEISNTKMTYQPDGYKISFSQYGINTTFTADPQLSDYNYGFIPYKYDVPTVPTTAIYTSAIISKQYSMITEDDTNVYCDLFVCSPTETKSTEFRIKKFNIFGNDWGLYINIPKDYHILCNSTPGTGNTSTQVLPEARWVSGFSNSDSYAGPQANTATIDTFYIYKGPDSTLQYKYVAYYCKNLNARAYFDVNVNARDKIVLFTKGWV